MALRLAIGAGRGRLVRQLVTESLLIAVAGGVLGLGVGYAGMMLFRQIEIPDAICRSRSRFEMDRRALVFSLVVAVASAVLFGLVPAIQATRTDLTAVMKASDSVAPGRRRRWGRAVLVGGQVAVSVVLLVVAMFMYRGFRTAARERSRLPDRSPADDELRYEPGALHRRAVAAVLRAGRRARARRAGRHSRHDDDVDPDVERLDRRRDDRAGRVSVPAREGERHGPGVDASTNTTSTRWGSRSSSGRNFRVETTTRRAARRDREPAARAALLAESGSDRQALSPDERRRRRGWRSSASRRPASTSSSPSRRRSSCTSRTGRSSRSG